jgi:hypothetical protein
MYDWKGNPLPSTNLDGPLFDGQIYVDDKNQVWRWDASLSVWLREEQMYLRETARFWIEASGRPIATTALSRCYNSRVRNQWDTHYTRTMCELRTSQSAQTLFRAHMDSSELQSWVFGALDTSGPQYDENAEVIVYEVVDPTIRCSRIQVWNSVYSTARGRAAYNRKYGRSSLGLPENYTCDPKWRGGGPYWADAWTEPGRDFLNAFHALVGPVNPNVSDGLIWFHSSHRNLYNQPRVGSRVVVPGSNEKTVYNSSSNTYVQSSGNFVVGTPKVFYRYGVAPTRQLDDPGSCVSGNDVLHSQVGGVMVYPLVNGDEYAFYVKPMGIDWVALSFDSTAPHQIVAITSYGNTPEDLRREPAGSWNGPQNLSYRFPLWNAVPITESFMRTSIDNANTPKRIRFIARNPTTGVISEPFATEVEVVTRKANITKCFEPRRVR